MIIKAKKQLILWAIYVFSAVLFSSSAYAAHGTYWTVNLKQLDMPASVVSPRAHPYIQPFNMWGSVTCYDFRSGREIGCYFTYEAVGVKKPFSNLENNGGHTHDVNKFPLSYEVPFFDKTTNTYSAKRYPIKFKNDIFPNDDYKVGGYTIAPPFVRADITHPAPNFTGIIMLETYIQTPPGWVCPLVYSHDSVKFIRPVRMYVDKALQQLGDPGPGDYYEKVRGGTTGHPDSMTYWGKEITIEGIQGIAKDYYALTSTPDYAKTGGTPRILSVNDMSLKYGGIFDISDNYLWPHQSHLWGGDADINRQGSNDVPINCLDDFMLRTAIDFNMGIVFKERPKSWYRSINKARGGYGYGSALLCESGGRVHIDFD